MMQRKTMIDWGRRLRATVPDCGGWQGAWAAQRRAQGERIQAIQAVLDLHGLQPLVAVIRKRRMCAMGGTGMSPHGDSDAG
jgi:hypothetical protein